MEAQVLPRTGRLFLPRSPKVLAAFSDDRLVEQVRRGNEDAFEAIYDRHHRGILAFCRHMLASPDEAEDAVQQTFISAYDALVADRRDIHLKAWLFTIARNRCLSILRARREQASELDDVPVAGLSDQVHQRAELRELLVDVRRLPIDQRAALVLSELGDLSHAEVGAIVGCEVAKVKSLVFQARSSLIESRRAREIPCQEIREQLATATGGALRRGPLRRHLRACSGCARFRDDVMRQRKLLAAALPVLPTLGLKKAALSALGIGGGGGAGGAAVGGGAIASLAGGGATVKLTAVAVVAGVAVGGGLVLDRQSKPPPAQAAGGQSSGGQAWPPPAALTGPGAHVKPAAAHPAKRRSAARHHAVAPHASTPPPHAVARPHASPSVPSASQGAQQSPTRRHASAGAPHTVHGHTQHTAGQHMTTHTTSPPPPPPAPPSPAAAPAPAPQTSSPPDHGHHFGWGHQHSDGMGGQQDGGDGSGDHHGDGGGNEGDHQHGD